MFCETQGFQLHIINENLSGLPEGTIEAARSLAKSQESNGWILL
jgi:peptidyl-dipeptidase Dcp